MILLCTALECNNNIRKSCSEYKNVTVREKRFIDYLLGREIITIDKCGEYENKPILKGNYPGDINNLKTLYINVGY